MVGETLGSYRIISQIGAGGMGEVFLAEHRHLRRKAAIKVLSRELAERPDLLERFFQEARATSMIEHPGIVQVFDCEVTPQGRPYIVMEYLAGETLAASLARRGPLPGPTAARLGRGMAEALGAAHAKGIVHRDLKPENVFVQTQPPDSVKLVDFGIAKLVGDVHGSQQVHRTSAGAMMGTPLYASPEQCRDAASIDFRTDLYSLGCVLYEMLCGHPPFQQRALGDLIVAHMLEAPRDLREVVPGVPPALAALAMELLRKNPAERPADMTAVADRLQAYASDVTTVPGPHAQRPAGAGVSGTASVAALPAGAAVGGATMGTTLGTTAAELVASAAGGGGASADAAADLDAPPRRKRGALIIGGVAAAAVVAIGVGALALRGGGGGSAGTVGATTAAAVVPATGAAKEPAAAKEAAVAKEAAAAKEAAVAKEAAAAKEPAVAKEPVAAKEPAAAKEPVAAKEPAARPAKEVAVAVADPATPPPAHAKEERKSGLRGAWEGDWTDAGKGQRGTLKLQIADDGAVSGALFNAGARQTFRLAGRMPSPGDLELACQCPPGAGFDVRGDVRAAGAGELRGRLTLSTGSRVFGNAEVALKREGAARAAGGGERGAGEGEGAPAPGGGGGGGRWAEILPGAWFQAEPSPTLYRFRSDGAGTRTTYPAGIQAAGQTFGFRWTLEGDALTMRFPSGWFDVVTMQGYQRAHNTLRRSSSKGWGNGPWVGCDSGKMPPEISRDTCR